jgi:hypothetical protein
MEFIQDSFYHTIQHELLGIGSRINNVEDFVDIFTEADLIARCGTMENQISSLETSKQDKFTGEITQYVRGNGSLATFPAIPSAQIPADWDETTTVARILNKPKKVFNFKSTVSGGNAVFHLTKNGLSSGEAFFPDGADLDSFQCTAEDSVSPHCFGTPVLSNGGKTLTVTVTKSSGLHVALLNLTLLGAPAAANGTVVRMIIAGNS